MPKPNTALTEAEWTIIKAVWDTEPCTAPVIHQKVRRQTAWSYSTVRTMMDRMVIKGLLTADRSHHPTVFGSAVTRKEAQRGELFYALKHAFNGALTPMVQCLLDSGKLSAAELAELEALIKAKAKGGRASARAQTSSPDPGGSQGSQGRSPSQE
jgi:BlaI family transcriptional regulator, penicillinase repressor